MSLGVGMKAVGGEGGSMGSSWGCFGESASAAPLDPGGAAARAEQIKKRATLDSSTIIKDGNGLEIAGSVQDA